MSRADTELDALIRPLTDAEIAAAIDLVAAQWPSVPRPCHEAMVLSDPWRDRQCIMGAFVGGRLAAQARLHHRPVRLGRARLSMSRVSSVVTHPDFRHRGLGHSVIRAGNEWMQQTGHHFALLTTGVPRFYAPLGWGQLEQVYHLMPLAGAPTFGEGRSDVTRVPIEAAPPDPAEVFAQSCGAHPISLARTPAYRAAWPEWARDNPWSGLLGNEWSVASKQGRTVAYGGMGTSLTEDDAGAIIEACCLPGEEEALFDVLDDLVGRGREAGREMIELNLPQDHPVIARVAGAAERKTASLFMARVLDLHDLLADLMPELQSRAAALAQPAEVRLDCPTGSATLSASSGAVTVKESAPAPTADLTPGGLAALVLGFTSAADLREAGELQASDAALEVLDILFPCQHSHHWQTDGL